jgi:hypothetical protein
MAMDFQMSDEALLEPDTYTLFVSMFAAGCENAFTVTVFSDKPLGSVDAGGKLREIPRDVPAA